MSTLYTPNAGLAKPARTDRNWDVPLNANTDALDACAAIGGLSVTPAEFPSATLNVKVAAGYFRKSDGTSVAYAGSLAQTVAANGTTCLWLTEAGTLGAGTTFPTGMNIVPLAAVTAGAATIVGIRDQRTPWFSFGLQTMGGGTVTSVGLSLPTDWTVTGAPVTNAGVLTATRANQNANVVLAGPVSGAPAAPGYRILAGADLPVFGPSGPTHAAGVVPDPGNSAGNARYLREDGSWALPPTGGGTGGGSGTVSSVGLSMPSPFLVSGNPVTSTGSFNVNWQLQPANQVLAGPASGTYAIPGFRALVGADVPVFGPSGSSHAPGAVPDPGSSPGSSRFLREDGTWAPPVSGAFGVTSVGLSLPAEFNVSGSPVTTAGTLTASWSVQGANRFFAGPVSGVASPSWRGLAAADLPLFGASGAAHASGAVPDPGASAGSARYLREDGGWSVPPSVSAPFTWNVTTPSSFPYTCSASDVFVLVDTSQARSITLPSGPAAGAGRFYLVKDASGSAATNNIAINVAGGGTIDGATTTPITSNYGEAEFISDGTNWKRKSNRPDLVDGNLAVNRKLLVGGSLNMSTCGFTTQTFTLNANLSINQINYTGPGSVTATLPPIASIGTNYVLIVKDIAGTAGSKNITIRPSGTDTIDGGSSLVIATNYGSVRFYCDGVSNWYTW